MMPTDPYSNPMTSLGPKRVMVKVTLSHQKGKHGWHPFIRKATAFS